MDLHHHRDREQPLVKTKIIATVGPASNSVETLRDLVIAGVDLFRLNFAHSDYNWSAKVVRSIRSISGELNRPIGILGDLAGPKIRLGQLPDGELTCRNGERYEFVRETVPHSRTQLTSTYEQLIDDLHVGDRVLLADGTVAMRVIEKPPDQSRVVCLVEQGGQIRTRQGINLPGVVLSTPALTEKDHSDLRWAVENNLDYLGLSFVRHPDDIRELRTAIEELHSETPPKIVAKIEKTEAVTHLEEILAETDAMMIARGDLGVEVDIARVPILQKRIIKLCNQSRIPVITATQMLDSMQFSDLPTRAEASDVANAVLDGSDALMLSGETAVGENPVKAVAMMSRIAHEAERLVPPNPPTDLQQSSRTHACVVTEAVTLGAGTAAEHLNADLIAVATHSGRTAMAISKQRGSVPILALSDRPETARRMCLYWGVTPLQTQAVYDLPRELIGFVVNWGKEEKVLGSGSHVVVVGSTNWADEGHDLMLVHAVP